MEHDNPFKAPEARVADVAIDSGDLVLEGQKLDAGRGSAWLGGGWELFKQAPGTWIGISVVYMVILMMLAFIPFIGSIGSNLLMPIFLGGIMLGCKALDEGNDLTVGHLFSGFSGHGGNLAIAGLIYLGGFMAIFIVLLAVGALLGFGAAAVAGKEVAMVVVVVIALIAMALIIPLVMAIWFAPALIVFHEVPPFEALKASFFASIKNWRPFLVYGLVYLVLALLACLPIFLGWLVLMPVMLASIYASYRDIFVRQ